MAVKNNRRAQMTRLLLRTALIELMQEKPFNEITIKEICEQADLNRTTFYLHYTDQFALLADVENEVYQKTLETLKNVKPAADAPGMIETFLNYIKSNASLFRILFVDADSEGFRSRFIQNMLNHLRFNIPLSCAAEEEPYLLCFLMQGSVHMIMEWIKRGFDMEPGQLAALIFRACNRVAP
ncbi:MAG: TetR/AcrR family transcriptional regulator [Clostridia bacterium]|jgi:AcrR family transcriptional regulator|nr:TetR/AcrR family transcriptional regulator [Clostridia bacterium]MBR2645847.1 TetR/AcrR family transcriptional regulator [Clostridia bacterium]